jgi:hypothetical protein
MDIETLAIKNNRAISTDLSNSFKNQWLSLEARSCPTPHAGIMQALQHPFPHKGWAR